ncbi:MAG: PA14 domain-containing protein [Candidatus Brocadiaceae bacterium]|nr:PA14 domain-containing protein [Candidatus Brocadiaceae bacterium]
MKTLEPTTRQYLVIYKKEIALFLLFFLAYGYFFHGGGANQNATYDQIRSIVEYGDLSIKRFSQNTHDVSVHGSAVYPNKAPGLTFLGVPIGFVLFNLKPLFLYFMEEDTYFLLICHLIAWWTVGLTSAVLCVVFFHFVQDLTQSTMAAFICAAGYGFGTNAYAYATLMYAHQVAAAFSFIGFYLIFIQKNRDTPSPTGFFLGGLLSGYAVIVEYPSIFCWLVLFGYALSLFFHKKKQIVFFLIGSSFPALLLLFYNYLCFENPIQFSYFSHFAKNQSAPVGLNETVKTLSLPTLARLYKISFHPFRGEFYYCPFLLLLFPGMYFFLKKKGIFREFLLCILIVIFYFIMNASYRYWYGGWSLGPRHLVAGVPFMALLIAFFAKKFPKISICVVFVSFFFMLMAVAVTPETPYGYKNPLLGLYAKNFFTSNLGINKHAVFTKNVYSDAFNSYNLGNVIFLPNALSLLPYYVVIIVCVIYFIRKAELKVTDLFTRSFFVSSMQGGIATLKKNSGYFKIALIVLLVGIIGLQIAIGIFGGRRVSTQEDTSGYISQPGFLGRYYQNESFKGRPKLVRYDDRISFNTDSFKDIFTEKNYSIIWSGSLFAPEDGNYKFLTISDDGSYLYINEKLVVDNGGVHGTRTKKDTVYLPKGYHDIKIKYFNNGGGCRIEVYWEAPKRPKMLLGKENVYTCAIPVQ